MMKERNIFTTEKDEQNTFSCPTAHKRQRTIYSQRHYLGTLKEKYMKK